MQPQFLSCSSHDGDAEQMHTVFILQAAATLYNIASREGHTLEVLSRSLQDSCMQLLGHSDNKLRKPTEDGGDGNAAHS